MIRPPRLVRDLAAAPGLTATVVVTLAIGIGCGTAVFSLVHAVLWRPLPYAHADELVRLRTDWGTLYGFAGGMDAATLGDLQSRSETADWAGLTLTSVRQWETDDLRTAVNVTRVTWNLLRVLGVDPVLGSHASRAEAERLTPDASDRVFITDRLWDVAFGRAPDAVGRVVRMDGASREVQGVLPPGFKLWLGSQGGTAVASDVDVLEVMASRTGAPRFSSNLRSIGRMHSDVTISAVRRDLDAQLSRLRMEHPGRFDDKRFVATSLLDDVSAESRPMMLLLLVAVVLVFVVATANASSLMVARAKRRESGLVVRAVLGASERRLLANAFAEAAPIAFLAIAAAVGVAWAAARGIALVVPGSIPRGTALLFDGSVLGAGAVLACVATVGASVGPVLFSLRVDPRAVLVDGGRTGSRRGVRMRKNLVGAQFALALTTVIASVVLIRTVNNLRHVQLGFAPDAVLSFRLLGYDTYLGPNGSGLATLWADLETQLASLPIVAAVGGTSAGPLADTAPIRWPYASEPGRGWDTGAPLGNAGTVQASYFEAMGIPILEGRGFVASDTMIDRVVIESRIAHDLWPGESAVGKKLYVNGGSEPYEVIGVVGPVRWEGLRDVGRRQFYVLNPGFIRLVVVRITAVTDPALALGPIRDRLHEIHPALTAYDAGGYTRFVDGAAKDTVFVAELLSGLGLVTVALTGFGFLGIVAYLVLLRRHEAAIRLALGARPGRVVLEAMRESLVIVAAALPFGIAGGVAVSASMRSTLFEVGVLSPGPLAIAAGGMVLFGVCVAYIPIRTLSQVDPASELRAGAA